MTSVERDDVVMESVGIDEEISIVEEPAKRFKFSDDLTDEEKLVSSPKNARFQLCCIGVEFHPSIRPVGNLFGFILASSVPWKQQMSSTDPISDFGMTTIFKHEWWENAILNTTSLSPTYPCSIPASTYVEIVSELYLTSKDGSDHIEVSDDIHGINFLKLWLQKDFQGGCHCDILKGDYGFVKLYYFSIRSAVEVVLDISFKGEPRFSQNKDFVVVMYAYYGPDFNYNVSNSDDKRRYQIKLFQTDFFSSLENAKIPLMQSMLAVPTSSSLVIHAFLHDCRSGGILMDDTHEFRARHIGVTDEASIEGTGCSFNVKVNWKPL